MHIKKLIFWRERFTTGAAILTGTTFLSYLTGLFRDRIFATTFGAGRELDLYNASFIIPDLLLSILVSSALSAAFIPLFTGLLAEDKKEEAYRLGNTIIHAAVIVIVASAFMVGLFMPSIAAIIAPGFNESELAELISLSRLMLISPVIMALSSSFGAMLVSFKSFLPYGISPVLYNIGIIGGAFTAPWLGVKGLVLGTLVGALLHLMPRLIAIRYSPFRYRPKLALHDPHFKKVLRLMIPKIVGHPVEQLTFLAFTRIATLLAAGSVASLSFARNFQSVPVSLFGIAFSVAIFPTLSECAARGQMGEFKKNFRKALRDILIFTVPSAVGLYVLSEIPIRLFLGGGNFTPDHVSRTALMLSLFALSIPTESVIHLLARSFYALKNTLTPVAVSVVGLGVIVFFAHYAVASIGIAALPLAFFLGSASEVVILGFLLRRRLAHMRGRRS